jgi:hypothetical protein
LGHPIKSFYPPRNALELKRICSRSTTFVEKWKKDMKKFDRVASALKIQKTFRGHLARKLYRKLKKEAQLKKEMEENARKAKLVKPKKKIKKKI